MAAVPDIRSAAGSSLPPRRGSPAALVEMAGLKPPKPDPITAMARTKASSTAA
jgi:hypothetical protein